MGRPRVAALLGVALLAGLAVGWLWASARAEVGANRIAEVALPDVTGAALHLHRSVPVIDLHADTLLWGRDLLERADVGHVDLPRLQEGGVALQVFTIVTQVPVDANLNATDPDGLDAITGLALLHRWPVRAVTSPLERALYQARRLEQAAQASGGELFVIRSVRDVDRLLNQRAHDPRVVGALLGVEGAHALEGDSRNLAPLFDAGVRVVGLAHFFDNDFAGSAHGLAKGGLTEEGRSLVVAMESRGVIVDLAHSSAETIDDVLDLAARPPIVSHTGVRGTCDNARNLSDEQIDRIAAAGGVIGIGFWSAAVCGTRPADVARAVRYVVDRVGDRYVALGSDYDGYTVVGFDVSRLPVLTQALLDAGLPESSVRKILGGNALRVLRATLPRR